MRAPGVLLQQDVVLCASKLLLSATSARAGRWMSSSTGQAANLDSWQRLETLQNLARLQRLQSLQSKAGGGCIEGRVRDALLNEPTGNFFVMLRFNRSSCFHAITLAALHSDASASSAAASSSRHMSSSGTAAICCTAHSSCRPFQVAEKAAALRTIHPNFCQ